MNLKEFQSNSGHVANLKEFLSTETGVAFLECLDQEAEAVASEKTTSEAWKGGELSTLARFRTLFDRASKFKEKTVRKPSSRQNVPAHSTSLPN